MKMHMRQRLIFLALSLSQWVGGRKLTKARSSAPPGMPLELAQLVDFHSNFWRTTTAPAELSRMLSSSHADVIAARDVANHSALNMAAYNANLQGVQALVAAGADVSNPDKNLHRPLHHAVLGMTPSAEVVSALLAAGADASAKDRFGKSPLAIAAKAAKLKHVARLLAAAARVKNPSQPHTMGSHEL
jgi:hypothetical protein